MSDFFKYFPQVKHNNTDVADITRRVKILEKLNQSPYLYQPYTIKMNETPEDVAYLYYGDASLSWLVLLANNIIDVASQWPKTTEEFETYVTYKYLDKYKDWLYQTYPNKFANERQLMLDLFDFLASRTKFDDYVTFAEIQAGAGRDIPDKYEGYWNYISTSTDSDINDNGIINSKDFELLRDQEIWTGEFKRFLLEIYDVPDPIRSVTDYTRNPDINHNIVYYEGQFEGEQPTIKWNVETWYKNSYAEEGAIDWGYATPLGANWTVWRIWEYEEAENESQRVVRLIDKSYIEQVKRELRGMYV